MGEADKCEIPPSFDMEDMGADVKIPGSDGGMETFRPGDQYVGMKYAGLQQSF